MRPTSASRLDIVAEANQIVGQEAFRVMKKARLKKNAVIYERAKDFLEGVHYERK